MKRRIFEGLVPRTLDFLRAATFQVVPPGILGAYAATWLSTLTGIGFPLAFGLTLAACAVLFLTAVARI